MRHLESAYLFTVHVDLKEPWQVGQTPLGNRRVFDFLGGRLEGRVNGRLLPSGADWMLTGRDGTARLDIRWVAELDDGSLLYTQASGRHFIAPEVSAAAKSRDDLVALDPASYYFRFAHSYETASEKYHWLNRIIAVGIGRLTTPGVAADVFEIV